MVLAARLLEKESRVNGSVVQGDDAGVKWGGGQCLG